MNQSPDKICEKAGKVKLTVKRLPRDRSCVLIEGDETAFKFLSDLFRAHARTKDCGFQMAPNGAGSALFTKGSELGLYLHRLPCTSRKRHSVPSRYRLVNSAASAILDRLK